VARLEDLTRGAAIRGMPDERFPEGDAFAVQNKSEACARRRAVW
jgi:hypothetical protein